MSELPKVATTHARRTAGAVAATVNGAALAPGATNGLAAPEAHARRNPLPVVVGVIVLGGAIGSMLMMARRKPTFRGKFADEPLAAVRGAILGALATVGQRLHEGYDTARDGAGKAINRVHTFGAGSADKSFSSRIGRIRNHLRFR